MIGQRSRPSLTVSASLSEGLVYGLRQSFAESVRNRVHDSKEHEFPTDSPFSAKICTLLPLSPPRRTSRLTLALAAGSCRVTADPSLPKDEVEQVTFKPSRSILYLMRPWFTTCEY